VETTAGVVRDNGVNTPHGIPSWENRHWGRTGSGRDALLTAISWATSISTRPRPTARNGRPRCDHAGAFRADFFITTKVGDVNLDRTVPAKRARADRLEVVNRPAADSLAVAERPGAVR
jgi:hypothetical protein